MSKRSSAQSAQRMSVRSTAGAGGKCLAGYGALVTGASFGLGRVIAKLFGMHGARVAVHHLRHEDGAKVVVSEIIKAGGYAFACQADVSSESDTLRLFSEAAFRLGGLQIVVTTPSPDFASTTVEATADDQRLIFNTNLIAQYLCALAAIREFRRWPAASNGLKTRGKILTVSSPHASAGWAGRMNYAGSAGASMLMSSMAQAVEGYRICMNCIVPLRHATANGKSPTNVRGTNESRKVARTALWLASAQSDSVTGRTVVVDADAGVRPCRCS